MANLGYGPKVRNLSTKETLSSLETWKQTMIYGLHLNPDFKPYMDTIFGRKSRLKPTRSLEDTQETVRETVNDVERDVTRIVKSKEEKLATVDLMLEQIANYATNIPRLDITKDSDSLSEVWNKIRQYFNIQRSGSLLNEVWNVKREFEETPQALFGRMKQLYCENLLTTDGLTHVEGRVLEDEELSPTLHNTIVLHWLQVLHPDLRNLVAQKFITQLRDRTFAAIFPEISRSIDSLLDELSESASARRSFPSYPNQYRSRVSPSTYEKPTYHNSFQKSGYHNNSSSKKHCEFCKMTRKRFFYTHSMDQCLFIKKLNSGKQASINLAEGEEIEHDDIQDHYEEFFQQSDSPEKPVRLVEHVIHRINTESSPVLRLNGEYDEVEATLDTGATANLLREDKALSLQAKITPTNQRVRWGDAKTNIDVLGETELTLYRNKKPFHLTAVVCRDIDTELLAGMPFLKANDIGIRPYTDEIILDGGEYIHYNSSSKPVNKVRRVTVSSNHSDTVLPGQSIKLSVPGCSGTVAVEPRYDASFNKIISDQSRMWPMPQILPVDNGTICIPNLSSEPVRVRKLEHICNVHPEVSPPDPLPEFKPINTAMTKPTLPKKGLYSDQVTLNPDNLLSKSEENLFRQTLETYDEVFNPKISVYNGKSGSCYVEVNIGANLPPQRKGRLPFYGKDDLADLQNKFDEMVEKGILSRPQDIGVTVENTHPSFFVKNKLKKRLVTDFSSIADYCRPTPSHLPSVEKTLHTVASWKHVIHTDMKDAYFQLLMKKSSKKYCGVHTPYKGLLVYNRGVMGLPGVEVALEELTCLILGDMVKQDKVAKLADDLYIGGDTIEDLRSNFTEVLLRLSENNLKLSAAKTTIAPKSVTILGWIWSAGELRASPHKLCALSSCPQPATVKALRSFLGAYRHISRVIKDHAKLLAPLEEAIKGKESRDKVLWSESLSEAFANAKTALLDAKTITMPQSSDQLCIMTDASVHPGAVGATLFAVREGKPLLAGFYNSKLPEFQKKWIPCEIEGLAIALALDHFSAHIIQSKLKPQVLTDSKPCVEAVQKLKRGEFSASARLSSFLSSVSRHQAQVIHVSGSKNLIADYQSRHPVECLSPECSICKFVGETVDSVVLQVTVEDVLQGKAQIPFTNRNSWKDVQGNCHDLRKVKEFKKQGTLPSKKTKNLRNVRRYLSKGTLLSHDGLLVNPQASPLGSVIERIVIPAGVLHGLLTMLHLRLSHPTAHQLTKAFSRYFFSLNLDKAITQVTNGCHQCAAIKEVPRSMVEQSTDDPPPVIAKRFAADIIKRYSQNIFLLRETVTSYTVTELIPDETKESIAEALIKQCNLMRPSTTSEITIRLDPAPSHQSLFNSLKTNSSLAKNNIKLEIGRILNLNKNPVAEKAIKELTRELLIINPTGGSVSPIVLSQATAVLNSRYRNSGLSAYEMFTQRDQISGDQLPIDDRDLILKQYNTRIANHPHSEKSKAGGRPPHLKPDVEVGSLVYFYRDRKKTAARQRYLITRHIGDSVKMRRFTFNLLGTKEYTAKLTEIYKVPSMESVELAEVKVESDSDEDKVPIKSQSNHQSDHDGDPQSDSSDTDVPSSSEESANESDEEEGLDSPYKRPGRYSLDPDAVLPRTISPDVKEREPRPRTRNKPDRYGVTASP